jgi:hypothetical protein
MQLSVVFITRKSSSFVLLQQCLVNFDGMLDFVIGIEDISRFWQRVRLVWDQHRDARRFSVFPEHYCRKLNRPLNVSKEPPIWSCHVNSLSSINLSTKIWLRAGQVMDVRSVWNQSLHLPEMTANCSQTSHFPVATAMRHSRLDGKFPKACDVKPWDKYPDTINNTGKTEGSLKFRKYHEFRTFMKEINFLVFTKCEPLSISVFPPVDIFQLSNHVCRSLQGILANSVRQPRITVTNTPSAAHCHLQSLHSHNFCQDNHSDWFVKDSSRSIHQRYHVFDHAIWYEAICYQGLNWYQAMPSVMNTTECGIGKVTETNGLCHHAKDLIDFCCDFCRENVL